MDDHSRFNAVYAPIPCICNVNKSSREEDVFRRFKAVVQSAVLLLLVWFRRLDGIPTLE